MAFEKTRKIYNESFNVFDEGASSYSYDGVVIDDDQVIDEELCVGDLKITGNARFSEVVDADTIEVIGTAEFKTFTACDDLHVSGSAIFKDEVIAESVVVRGGASINGKVNTDLLIVEGKVRANSNINVLSVSISGYLNCLHKLMFDKCHVKGSLVCAGVVKGIDIRFKSQEQSTVKRLVVDGIISMGKPTKGAYILVCDEVDCDSAKIEHTKIEHLMCDECIIGKGCHIGVLECRGEAQISNDAFVEKIIEI